MIDNSMIGLAIFFIALVINRTIMTRALKKLDDKTKLKFIEVFSSRNNISLIVSLIFVFLYFVAAQTLPHFMLYITLAYFTVFIVYMLASFFSTYRKLKKIEVPASYLKSFLTGYSIFIFGFLSLAVTVSWFWIGLNKL